MPPFEPGAQARQATRTGRSVPDALGCFHCGLPVPPGPAIASVVRGGSRRFCCAGCAAVSRSISELGLDDYYRLRDANAERPAERDGNAAVFDEPALTARYVTDLDNGLAEAQLLVDGMRCAACAWLIEQTLSRLHGVDAVSVQMPRKRVTVRWRRDAIRPSALIRAIGRIGYRAWPFEEGKVAALDAGEKRRLTRRLWVAGLAMMQVMMYAVPAYIAVDGEMTSDAESLMRWAGLVLTLPVVLYSAVPFFGGAWRSLRAHTLGMDVPVALGIAVAFAASAWSTVAGHGAVYFDSVSMFVFLLLGARYLELVALTRAGGALASLGKIVPDEAHRLRGLRSLDTDTVLAAAIVRGDRILVRPGETAPADGVLETPLATVSEAWMSGESRPLTRRRGDAIPAGAVNAGSAFVLAVERVGNETALSGIVRLVERSLSDRPAWVTRAERAVPWFVGAVLAAAALSGVAWTAIDPSRALGVAVAVLIVTCPCALALATPVALTVATGALARANLAVTRGSTIEGLADVTHVVFDKTGTLTAGEPVLVDVLALGALDRDTALAVAAALAQGSSHPLDVVLRRAAPAGGAHSIAAMEHATTPGQGVAAVVGGLRHRLGRASFAGELAGSPPPLATPRTGDTIAWLASEAGWIAAFRFRDATRADARAAVDQLERMGIAVSLVSGDEKAIVDDTAAALGIAHVVARATPAAKCAYVRDLQSRKTVVAMVGDGINDAPVLAQADVAIAMNGGADLAKLRADAVLLSDAPADVVRAIAIARRVRSVIRQNLVWGLGYNLVVIPLAVTGHLSPLVAGLGMSLSSLLVVLNSLRAR